MKNTAPGAIRKTHGHPASAARAMKPSHPPDHQGGDHSRHHELKADVDHERARIQNPAPNRREPCTETSTNPKNTTNTKPAPTKSRRPVKPHRHLADRKSWRQWLDATPADSSGDSPSFSGILRQIHARVSAGDILSRSHAEHDKDDKSRGKTAGENHFGGVGHEVIASRETCDGSGQRANGKIPTTAPQAN